MAARTILEKSPESLLRLHGSHAQWRARIWNAASCEEALLAAQHRLYNPSDDGRIKWLLQWADVLEGSRRSIDPRVTDTMEFLCHIPAPFTGKHLAAGERLNGTPAGEHLTLVQGS